MRGLWTFCCLALLLSGCASVPEPSAVAPAYCWMSTEQLQARVRVFPQVSEQQTLEAATQILQAAGGSEMRIVREPHGLQAEFHRERTFYALFVAHQSSVWDRWAIATRSQGDATQVCVWVQGQFYSDTFVLGAEPVTHIIYPASVVEREVGKGFKPPAQAYALSLETFWQRFEYALHLRQEWPSCSNAEISGEDTAKRKLLWNPLCHALVDEALPNRQP